MLACDFDGTLVGPGDRGLDDTRKVMELCALQGVRFTIATGRAFGAIEKYLRSLQISGPVITNGGAMVSALDRDPIMEQPIDPRVCREIVSELRRTRVPFYLTVGKHMVTEWDGPETLDYSQNLGYAIRTVPSLSGKEFSPTQIVVRLPANRRDLADLITARSWVRDRFGPGVSVIRSLPHLIEFQAEGVSKGKGLEFLASGMGLSASEVLAVGDSLNDLDMLAWAGHRACVANSHPLVMKSVPLVSGESYAAGVLEIARQVLR